MVEPAILATLAAYDTAEALIALGWPVHPFGPDRDEWQIGDFILLNGDHMELAVHCGVRLGCAEPDEPR